MTERATEARPPAAPEVPAPIRAACLILLAEAAGLVAAVVVLLVKTVTGRPESIDLALLDAGFAAGGALLLLFGARGLQRLRPAARTPVVVLQLLALPVAYTLAFPAHRLAYGAPILVAALGVIYLLFTPPARSVLDRGATGR